MTAAPPPARPRTSYDAVPYQSRPFAFTHPDRLATVATVLGLTPPAVETCRVLELGCAEGGNLLPMAAALPHARFVGVDLSARQIDAGLRAVRAAGLANVELRAASILDLGPDDGEFDYVVCHGVYSWVPPAVREKILSVCRHNLAPNGVAYVSYNTHPGWRMRGTVRDLMLYHARKFAGPAEKVRQSRALLKFLAGSTSRKDGPFAALLAEELTELTPKPDHYLLHEFLEDHNEPVYFHQFVDQAAAHGLRYLGEAEVSLMAVNAFPAETRAVLSRVATDPVDLEQYMDFLRNRSFRQTLLCRAEAKAWRANDPTRIAGLHVASTAKPQAAGPDAPPDDRERFAGPGGVTLSTAEPILKAAMTELAETAPRGVPFADLVARAQGRLGRADAADAGRLAAGLLNCYTTSGLLQLSTLGPAYAAEAGESPRATPLARWQAEAGGAVTNLRHQVVRLKDPDRQTLRHLDGTRDRAALTDILVGLIDLGVLQANGASGKPADPAGLRETVGEYLGQALPRLAANAFIVTPDAG